MWTRAALCGKLGVFLSDERRPRPVLGPTLHHEDPELPRAWAPADAVCPLWVQSSFSREPGLIEAL